MTDDDALKFIIYALREKGEAGFCQYGYGVWLPHIILKQLDLPLREYNSKPVSDASPHFYTAAWELCRRGILRPGVRTLGEQATDSGSAGDGYTVTPFGKTWLAEAEHDDFVPTEPERFGKLLERFRSRLGAGFHQRAQEAVRCYGAHAYLACCVMCGGAAESILLAVAIAKEGDEQKILKMYRAANGRSKVENLVIGQATPQMQTQFRGFTTLMNYWRDEAAHGTTSQIDDDEAYTSLPLLLRFAHFVNDRWNELTT